MDRYVRGIEDHIVRQRSLNKAGIMKYFKKEEIDDYRAPIARLLQEQQEEARQQPG